MLLIRYLLILKDLRVPVVFWIDVVFYSFFYSIYTLYIFLIFKQNLVTSLNLTAHSFAPKVHVISDCNFKWAFSSSVWKSKGHRIFFKMLKFSKKSMPNCTYILKKFLIIAVTTKCPKNLQTHQKTILVFYVVSMVITVHIATDCSSLNCLYRQKNWYYYTVFEYIMKITVVLSFKF